MGSHPEHSRLDGTHRAIATVRLDSLRLSRRFLAGPLRARDLTCRCSTLSQSA